jgi:1-acyl-sn-glycerol-3-phosphate acyltransferase
MDIEKNAQRKELLNRIEELEKTGQFDIDAADNPEAPVLMPDQVDYLKEKTLNKFKAFFYNELGEILYKILEKNNQIIIKEVRGIENLNSVTTGGIITSNHFNPMEGLSVIKTFEDSMQGKKHRIYEVIREGNYTNFPGLYGMLFRNCYTLPLSSNHQTMKKFYEATEKILKNGDFILIYPEQSLWWNYRKPKPLKEGAYRFAVKNNVPIIPFFITTKETDILDESGFPNLEYYIHIEKPIYPESSFSLKENIAKMREANFRIWKEIYEKFYGTKLQYNCDYEKLPDYILNIINEK